MQRALFVGIAGDGGDRGAGFRTNVGFFNSDYGISNGREKSATLTLYGGNGAVLGTPVVVSFGLGTQVNDIFSAAGAGSVASREASLLVELSDPVYAYATIIDNKTGDATYVTPIEADPTAQKLAMSGRISTNRQGVSVAGIPITVTQNGQSPVTRTDSAGAYYIYPLAYGYATIAFSPGGSCPDVTLTAFVPVAVLNLSPQICP